MRDGSYICLHMHDDTSLGCLRYPEMQVEPFRVWPLVPRPRQTGWGAHAYCHIWLRTIWHPHREMTGSECQILTSVIVTTHHTGSTPHQDEAMKVVDKSNLPWRGCHSTVCNMGCSTATSLALLPMENWTVMQSDGSMRNRGWGHWTYLWATAADIEEGDPNNKPNFDRAKREAKETEIGE